MSIIIFAVTESTSVILTPVLLSGDRILEPPDVQKNKTGCNIVRRFRFSALTVEFVNLKD